MPWQSPSLTARWGAYRKPDPEEQKQVVEGVQLALGAPTKLLTTRGALEKLRDEGFIDVDNLEAVIDELKKEQAEADEKKKADAENELNNAIELADATAKARAKSAGGKPPASRA